MNLIFSVPRGDKTLLARLLARLLACSLARLLACSLARLLACSLVCLFVYHLWKQHNNLSYYPDVLFSGLLVHI